MKIDCVLVLIGLVQLMHVCLLICLLVDNRKTKKRLRLLEWDAQAKGLKVCSTRILQEYAESLDAKKVDKLSPFLQQIHENIIALYDKQIIGEKEKKDFEDLIFQGIISDDALQDD